MSWSNTSDITTYKSWHRSSHELTKWMLPLCYRLFLSLHSIIAASVHPSLLDSWLWLWQEKQDTCVFNLWVTSCRLKRFVNFKPIFYMNYLMIYIFKLFKLLWGLVRHDLTSLLVVLHMQLSYQLTLSVIISGLDEAVLSRPLLSSIVSPLIWKENENVIK